MIREELLEMLDMESAEDFGYFEQYADLIESKDEIDYDDFYYVLSKADKDTLAEITLNYFEELEKFLPSGSDDIFGIIDNVANDLKMIVNDFDALDSKREFIQKLFTFHEWYTKEGGASVDGEECSVVDAIFEYRAAKLENKEHKYDFTNSLDYKLDYISMPIGGFSDNDDEDEFTV